MANGNSAVGIGKSRTDTSVVSSSVQDEIDELINKYKGKRYLKWTLDMDKFLSELYHNSIPISVIVIIFNKKYPNQYFSYDRIYKRCFNLGLIAGRLNQGVVDLENNKIKWRTSKCKKKENQEN
jgi:hypothetical protein